MSGFPESLTAYQDAALKALGRRYIRSVDDPDPDTYRLQLVALGVNDELGIQWMLESWKVLREEREQPPEVVPASVAADKQASDAQWSLIRQLLKGQKPPDGPLTKDEASRVIDQLKDGSYKAEAWAVPF
jgi:hypothetical protein